MRWKGGRRSQHIQDVRGRSASPRGGLPLRLLTSKGGLVILAIAGAAYFMGVDPRLILSVLSGGQQITQTAPQPVNPEQQELADFVSVVLADTEDTWHPLFQSQGLTYQEPTLVLFSGSVNSACGFAQSAMGPFYCPADKKVYIDLSFYRDLKDRHQAPGDFAQAYVIAHEVGHHVQTLLGISAKVRQLQQNATEVEANQLQVRMELQADCFAGLWAHHADAARQILEDGDIDEALNAASQIGDDTLQKKGRGQVVPESFTHGSAKQRSRWFKRGVELGELAACDTFSTKTL
jgi:predicted metalloprotease